METVYWINDVALTDREKGWVIEKATKSPGAWSQEISTMQIAGQDGVELTAVPVLSPGELAVSVAVLAESYAERMARQNKLMQLLRGVVRVRFQPPDGSPIECDGLVSSVTVDEVSRSAVKVLVTFKLPYPVWYGTTRSGTVNKGAGVELLVLSGSAPASITWKLKNATYFKATCKVSGDETVLSGGAKLADLTIDGWDTPAGGRLESYGRVHPSHEGKYVVDIDTDAETISWEARDAWL